MDLTIAGYGFLPFKRLKAFLNNELLDDLNKIDSCYKTKIVVLNEFYSGENDIESGYLKLKFLRFN